MYFHKLSKISLTGLFIGAIGVSLFGVQPVSAQNESPALEELSIEDLEGVINLPTSARLRRESEEDLTNPRDVFSNEALRQEFLGDKPKYVYVPEGVDPMIIPWIRNQIVAGELLSDATEAFDKAQLSGDVRAARAILKSLEDITIQYPDAPQVPEAQVLSTQITEWVIEMTKPTIVDGDPSGKKDDDELTPTIQLPLPQWVRNNTTGVIVDKSDPKESVVIVGDFILRPGESLVDRYAGVSVKEIASQRVVYEYNNRDHVVIVESN